MSAQSGSGPTGSVIVLGANGRLGQACVAAFHSEGWTVCALARSAPETERLEHVDYIDGDALDPATLTKAVAGFDVIVNAVNVSYGEWAAVTPLLTRTVSLAAADTGATVIVPGNVYHYGADMPELLSETTPAKPTTNLGKVRLAMEQSYRQRSAMEGFQTLILRAGDYLDGRRTGGWFDAQIANKLYEGKVTYPGPLDVPHEWAYLPDFARAIVALAGERDHLPAFMSMGFPGHVLSGQDLIDGLAQANSQDLKVGSVPWPMLKLMSFFSRNLKGVTDMSYLWTRPHAIDGRAFQTLFPNFRRTPIAQALADVCVQLAQPKP